MRSTVMLWICFGWSTCSSVSAESLPILPPPDGEKLLAGLTQAISDFSFSATDRSQRSDCGASEFYASMDGLHQERAIRGNQAHHLHSLL